MYEMLLIKEKRSSLNSQTDSILAKLFINYFVPLFFKFNVFYTFVSNIYRFMVSLFAFGNGYMSSPKRHVLIALLFIL